MGFELSGRRVAIPPHFLYPPLGYFNKLHPMYILLYMKYMNAGIGAFVPIHVGCCTSVSISVQFVYVPVCVFCGCVVQSILCFWYFICVCELHSKAINIRITVFIRILVNMVESFDALDIDTSTYTLRRYHNRTFQNAFYEICPSVIWPMKCSKMQLVQMERILVNVKHDESIAYRRQRGDMEMQQKRFKHENGKIYHDFQAKNRIVARQLHLVFAVKE